MRTLFARVARTALLLSLAASCTEVPPDAALADIALEGLEGALWRPLAHEGPALRAVVFVTDTCPIANGYAPELERIAAEYRPRGVGLALVHVDRELSATDAATHRAEHDLTWPVGIDRAHALVGALGATVTPEAFVLRRDEDGWRVCYRGRIDNRVTDFGKQRLEPAARDLRAALDAALAGREPDPARTEAIGCPIPTHP